MRRSVDQNDQPTERDGDATSGVHPAPADEATPAAPASTVTAMPAKSANGTVATPKSCNRRIGPYYFNLEDRLGKGVYGEVFRAYLLASSPCSCPLENARESYEEEPVTPRELPALEEREGITVALKRMTNPAPADGWTAATLREIAVLQELGNSKNPEDRAGFIPHARAVFPLPAVSNSSRRPSMRSWSGLTDFQLLTTSTTAGLSQDDDLNSFNTNSCADSSTTPAQIRPLELPSTFATGHRRQLTAAQRAVRDGAHCIIKLHKFMLDDATGTAYLATEFCEGGDLYAFLRKKTEGELRISDPALYKRWMRQILQGVAFMHSRHISHRDLKPQNVLLKKRSLTDMESYPRSTNSNTSRNSSDAAGVPSSTVPSNHLGWQYDLKVGDFGLSRVEDIPIKKYEHEAITLGYRSPDALLGNLYLHFAADVWSMGCILLEAASGQPMFRGRDDEEQLKRILIRFGGVDTESFPSATKYVHSSRKASLLARLIQYRRDETAKESYQARFDEEMRLMQEQAATYPPDFLDHIVQQEPRHVAVIRLHLRDYFSRHPGMDVLGEDGLDVISRMLMLEPSARISLEGTLAHPFFATEHFTADLEDDDQFMELHDFEETTVHRAPWIAQAEADTLLTPPGTTGSLVNAGGRPPILALRGHNNSHNSDNNSTNVVMQPGSMLNDAVLRIKGDASAADGAMGQSCPNNANSTSGANDTRPPASYVLPAYLAQQRLSQSTSELRTAENNANNTKAGVVAGTTGMGMSGMRTGHAMAPLTGSANRSNTSRSYLGSQTDPSDPN